MISMAKVSIIGYLGKDGEKVVSPAGKELTTFSVAVSDGKESATTWFKVVCFGKAAETVAERAKKGVPVYVEGKLKVSEWQNKAGEKKQSLEVVAQTVVFLT